MMVSYFSVTYKLKLNKGDIKAVQGDSGHSQTDMVTDVYSHIIDETEKRTLNYLKMHFSKKIILIQIWFLKKSIWNY